MIDRLLTTLGAIALAATFLTTPATLAQTTEPVVPDKKLEDVAKLTVRGEIELKKAADQIRLRVGVVTEATEAGEALEQNSTKMRDVVAALKRTGLTDDEYETGRFQIRPKYTRRPRQPDADWSPKIIGYEVTNSVSIETKKLDIAGDVISAGNRAGANTVEVTGFALSNPREFRPELIAGATRNGLADARALAEAANLRLVRIISISLDGMSTRAESMMMASRGRAMADSSTPPIEAGDVSLRANVNIVYEIAPAD